MSQRKPRGYWTKENTIKEIQALAKELGTRYLPTQKQMSAHNNSLTIYASGLFESRSELAQAAGLMLTEKQLHQEKAKNHKSISYIKARIEELRTSRNIYRMPTMREIEEFQPGLYDAIVNHHGGISAVATLMGLESERKPLGFWQGPENLAVELKKWISDNNYPKDRMPTSNDLQDSGPHGRKILSAITRYHGGFYEVAKKLEKKLTHAIMPPGYWLDFEKVDLAIREIAENSGTPNIMPTYEELGPPLIHACNRHHGGFKAVAERLDLLIIRTHKNAEVSRLMSSTAGLKETTLYAFTTRLNNDYSKIGITYKYALRKADDTLGIYPETPDWHKLYNRRMAWAIEQTILRDTIKEHPGAPELTEWQGWSELRKTSAIRLDLLDDYCEYLESMIEEIGWREYVLRNEFLFKDDFENFEE